MNAHWQNGVPHRNRVSVLWNTYYLPLRLENEFNNVSEHTSSTRNYVVQIDWPAEVFPPAPIETFAAALWLFELEPLLLSSERSTTGGPEPPLPPLASESPMDTILLDFRGSLVSLRHLLSKIVWWWSWWFDVFFVFMFGWRDEHRSKRNCPLSSFSLYLNLARNGVCRFCVTSIEFCIWKWCSFVFSHSQTFIYFPAYSRIFVIEVKNVYQILTLLLFS